MIAGDDVSNGAMFWKITSHSVRERKLGYFPYSSSLLQAVVALSAFRMGGYDAEDLGAEDPFDTTSPSTTATQIFTNAPTGDTSSPTSSQLIHHQQYQLKRPR